MQHIYTEVFTDYPLQNAHTHARMHTRTRRHTHAHTLTHTRAHTRAHTRTHTLTHAHTHTFCSTSCFAIKKIVGDFNGGIPPVTQTQNRINTFPSLTNDLPPSVNVSDENWKATLKKNQRVWISLNLIKLFCIPKSANLPHNYLCEHYGGKRIVHKKWTLY